MRKVLLGLAFVFSAGFVLAQQPPIPAPAPAATATTDFYPTKKGSKWVYKAGEVEVTLQAGDTDAKSNETKLETVVQGSIQVLSLMLNNPVITAGAGCTEFYLARHIRSKVHSQYFLKVPSWLSSSDPT